MTATPVDGHGAPSEAMDDEFDTVATWTADAVRALGPAHAVAAACQGSGSPAALDWLLDHLGLAEDVPFLDVGAGIGGPAEYAARGTGARPVLVDPAPAACRAADEMFRRPALIADGAALPIATASLDIVWSLGVLCTVQDKPTHLAEIARVLAPRGRLGLLVFERTVAQVPDPPEGNHFPDAHELADLLSRVGLHVCASVDLADLSAAPAQWQQRADEVADWIGQRHAPEPAWQRAHEQQTRLGHLIQSGLVVGRMLTARLGTG